MRKDKEFEKWFDDYFCDAQGEDSPYSYDDVRKAYYNGWKRHKESKKKV